MPEHDLANRQKYPLRWVIFGDVGRNHTDVKRLEVSPHRVRWVREPPVGKRISHEQITELVVYRGVWHRKNRQDGEPGHDSQDTDRCHGQRAALGEPAKTGFNTLEPTRAPMRKREGPENRHYAEAYFNSQHSCLVAYLGDTECTT